MKNKTLENVENLQNEMHSFIENFSKYFDENNFLYDEIKDVFYLIKISKMQEEIDQLKKMIK